ncbi:MAG: N-carbamoylputrescine amidase [Dongiaceae bacterium]
MQQVTVAATQFACNPDRERNIATAERLVREAAGQGAQIVMLPELFETPYFAKDQRQEFFALARPIDRNPMLARMSELAQELQIVLPVPFFERANNAYFNAVMVMNADGEPLGSYRKSHIPDGYGYEEKFYFNPGDTGFRVWDTAYLQLGIGICWDQWFPECARAMALQGADLLIYPTAIGSTIGEVQPSSRRRWQRAMQGHAVSNCMPVAAANRIGTEKGHSGEITFYGASFIAGPDGEIIAEAGDKEAIVTAQFDFEEIRLERAAWGFFRDRRPELYTSLLTLDGAHWVE